jgi:hypothetical protein
MTKWNGSALDEPLAALSEHFELNFPSPLDHHRALTQQQANALGVLALFQAAYPLLSHSTPPPKSVPISCGPGGVALEPTFPTQTLSCAALLVYSVRPGLTHDAVARLGTPYARLCSTSPRGSCARRTPDSVGMDSNLS